MSEGELILWLSERPNSVSLQIKNKFFTRLRLCLNILLEQKITFSGKVIWLNHYNEITILKEMKEKKAVKK